MKKRILLIFVFVALSFGLYCGLLEPEKPAGSLGIVLKEKTHQQILPKTNATVSLEAVQCIVKKGNQAVFDNDLTKKPEGGFHGEITDLDPADNYSVLLYGKNNSNNILSRAYKNGISVSAGKQTTVTLSWDSFSPVLSSPTDGSSLAQPRPTFNWSTVTGATLYELQVDINSNFSNPSSKSDLTTNSYTAEIDLADGTYFWRVRNKDSEDNWGDWSLVFSFTISQNYTLQIQVSPVGAGIVTKEPDKSNYTADDQVLLTALAVVGYQFDHWEGDASGSNSSIVLDMTGSKNVTAVFGVVSGLVLSVSSNPPSAGSITKDPDKSSYSYGESVTLSVNEAVGYEFSYWGGDASGTNKTTTITMTTNKIVTANFNQLSYTFTTSASPAAGGNISRDPDKSTYTYGDQVTLTATPSTGYGFVRWEGDAGGTSASTTIIIDGNKNVSAIFDQISGLSLTVSANPANGGSITKNPDKTSYSFGETVTLTAHAAAGYSFDFWDGDATGTNGTTTVTMNANKNVTANFAQESYTLSITTTPTAGGNVIKNPDSSTYLYGETVNLSAIPATGYRFVQWEGDATGNNASTSIIITGNKSVTAVFEQISGLSLTVAANPPSGGEISKNPDKNSYTYGETVSLTAKPADGFKFTIWSEDASGTDVTTSVIMNSNKTAVANFAQVTYTLTIYVTPVGGGTVQREPDKTDYSYGEKVTLTAIPESGYRFVRWDGNVSSTNATMVVTMDANKTIGVIFEAISGLSLTVTANPTYGGTITKAPDKTSYDYGESVTLTATPAAGYEFSHWGNILGAVDESNTLIVVMNENKSLVAYFKKTAYTLFVSTIPLVGGTVIVDPNKDSYTSGDVVSLTASPAHEYHFLRWQGSVSGTEITTTVTMDTNKYVYAIFGKDIPRQYLAYYPFNGSAKDESGNGYNGTVFSASLAKDRFNQRDRAYYFEGEDDYIRLNTSDLLKTNDVNTISFWIKTPGFTVGRIISDRGDLFSVDLTIQARGVIEYHMNDADGLAQSHRGSTSLRDETWHHLVVLKNGKTIQFYVDSKQDSEPETLKVSNCDENTVIEFGRSQRNDGNGYFTGHIDDIRIYDYLLSEDEIQSLFNEGGWVEE